MTPPAEVLLLPPSEFQWQHRWPVPSRWGGEWQGPACCHLQDRSSPTASPTPSRPWVLFPPGAGFGGLSSWGLPFPGPLARNLMCEGSCVSLCCWCSGLLGPQLLVGGLRLLSVCPAWLASSLPFGDLVSVLNPGQGSGWAWWREGHVCSLFLWVAPCLGTAFQQAGGAVDWLLCCPEVKQGAQGAWCSR